MFPLSENLVIRNKTTEVESILLLVTEPLVDTALKCHREVVSRIVVC